MMSKNVKTIQTDYKIPCEYKCLWMFECIFECSQPSYRNCSNSKTSFFFPWLSTFSSLWDKQKMDQIQVEIQPEITRTILCTYARQNSQFRFLNINRISPKSNYSFWMPKLLSFKLNQRWKKSKCILNMSLCHFFSSTCSSWKMKKKTWIEII